MTLPQSGPAVSIAPPKGAHPRYRDGWRRGDRYALSGGDLNADGPPRADETTWEGFVDALSAHRAARVSGPAL